MYIRISFIFLGKIQSTPSLSHIQHAVKTDQNVRMWIKGCHCLLELDFLFFQFLRTLMKLLSFRSLYSFIASAINGIARESPLALCLTHSKRAAVLPTIMVKTHLIPVQGGRWLHVGTVRKNRQVVWCEVVKGGCKLACFNSGS